jgi:hypothetical protein
MRSAPSTSALVSFAQIRRGSRVVAERAAHVGVLVQKVDELAAQFELAPPSALPDGIDAAHALPFLVVRATLRFGNGYEPKLRLPEGSTVTERLDESLASVFSSSGPLTAREMVHATPADLADLRGQGLEDPPQAEFVELQTRALRDLGRYLIDRHEGSFSRLVEYAAGSAARLCESLSTIPYFCDVQRYRGIEVAFHHRAQRLVIDLADHAKNDGLGSFEDLRELVPSSDTDCALALRNAGVLSFDEQLTERVDKGEIVPAHSEREVEIRAATVHACERILAVVRKRDASATSSEIDRWLRLRARQARRAGAQPPRTRTVNY